MAQNNGVLEPTSWVQCDRCTKWRRINQSVAESLAEEEPWYCEMSADPIYNACSVPQELSDQDIDQQGAEPEPEEKPAPAGKKPDKRQGKLRKRPPVWQKVTNNIYLHRERKTQDEDDIMICQCKTIWATDTTTIGCAEHCLNRMLNIECVPEYCPSGDRCTNRAFSQRKYSPLDVKRAGAKGFGLFAKTDLKAGDFIIEYVGEVLDEDEYARRREFYAGTGQRHYYFMNVGNGEVIDATRRGGLGRFINHSCEPNCETQKWVVRGELAIGLFALEDVKAGTELTFDYNFERYGDKPMKCLCESKNCRGIIGGSQEAVSAAEKAASKKKSAPEEEVEEDIEPIMITEKEQDAALTAILDRAVGLGWESGWNAKMTKRLQTLAVKKGYDLSKVTAPAGEEDEASGAEDEDLEIAAAAAAAAIAATGAGGTTGKKSGPKRPRAPKQQRKKADPDYDKRHQQQLEILQQEQKQQQQAASSDRQAASSGRAATTSAIKGDDVTSVASLGKDREGSKSEAQPQTTPMTSGGYIPKRAPSMGGGSRAVSSRRRSEVDRRLDGLILASGRLKDGNAATVVRFLRLFNLCDLSPTVSRTEEEALAAAAAQQAQQKSIGGGGGGTKEQQPTATSTGTATATGIAIKDEKAKSTSRADSGSLPLNAATAAAAGDNNNNNNTREDGEVSPERPSSGFGANTTTTGPIVISKRQAAAAPGGGYVAGSSRDPADTRYSEEEEGPFQQQQRHRAPSPPGTELSPRQQARIADMSLLLDVIIKTDMPSVRQELVKCGVLRQFLIAVGRNTSGRYAVALRKILKTVETLPFVADDMHHTRSAHGSFADLLRYLTGHPDYEVRNRSWALLKKWPVSACTRPVITDSKHSMARVAPNLVPGRDERDGGGPRDTPMGQGIRGDSSREGEGRPYSASRARSGGPYSQPPPYSRDGGQWRGGGDGRDALSPRAPGFHSPSAVLSPRDGPSSYHPRDKDPLPPSRLAGPRPYMSSGGRGPPPPYTDRDYRDNGPPPRYSNGRGGGRDGPPPAWRSEGRGGGGGDRPPYDDRYSSYSREREPYRGGGGEDRYPPGRDIEMRDGGRDYPPSSRERDYYYRDGGERGGGGYRGGGRDGGGSYPYSSGGGRGGGPPPYSSSYNRDQRGDLYNDRGRGPSPPPGPAAGADRSNMPLSGRKRSRWEDTGPVDYTGNGGTNGNGTAFTTAAEQQQQPPLPSPVTDDDAQQRGNGSSYYQQQGSAPAAAEPSSAPGTASRTKSEQYQVETWDSPDVAFEVAVADIVSRRVGKYEQHDHPMRIKREEASEIFKKVRREVIAKEQIAFDDRTRLGQFKPIERQKLETRIKEFVRDSVKRLKMK